MAHLILLIISISAPFFTMFYIIFMAFLTVPVVFAVSVGVELVLRLRLAANRTGYYFNWFAVLRGFLNQLAALVSVIECLLICCHVAYVKYLSKFFSM